jgi:hypothetical protein
MRFQRLIFAVILACGVSACAKDVQGVTHTPPPLAYVRYINAVSDTFNMDFRAVDQVEYSQPFLNTLFRGLGEGNYQGYEAGSRHLRIFLDPNPTARTDGVDPAVVSTVMVDTTLSLTAGTYYTLLHVGGARTGAPVKAKLLVLTDALPTQSTSSVQYRIINTTTVQGTVDVYVSATGATTGTPVQVGSLSSTSYFSQAPGAIIMKMMAPGTQNAVGSAAGYTVQAGTAGTTLADPLYGSGQGGSIFTAFIFDASAAGTKGAVFATPGIVFFPDMQPPRTTSP